MKDYIEAIMAAYNDWFGEPSDVMYSTDMRNSAGLTEMGVVIYLPEHTVEGSTKTLLGTAGMSARKMIGPVPLAELGIEIEGDLTPEALKFVVNRLMQLACVPFKISKGYSLNSVIDADKSPLFEPFDTVYLLEWDVYNKLRPREFNKEVQLLRLVPIFESEAVFIESSQNRDMAYLSLKRKGLNPADFKRKSAV